jgi:hypothetical protein
VRWQEGYGSYFRGDRSGKRSGKGSGLTSDVSPRKIGIECAAWFPKRNKKGSKRINLMLPERKPKVSDADSLEFPPPG